VLYPGQIAKVNSSGVVTVAATTPGATNTSLIGVIAHYKPAGASESRVKVYDSPNQLFTIQAATDNVATLATMLFQNASLTAVTAVSSALQQSRMELHEVTTGTTGPDCLKIVGITRLINNALGDNVELIVKVRPKFHLLANENSV
jgi:hypothetical protein